MALTQCPCCKQKISDFAITCPHCGEPLRQQVPSNNYNQQEPNEYKGKKNKNKLIIILLTVILIAIATILGLNTYNKAHSSDNDEISTITADYNFSVQNGISGTTGSKNCFIPELGAPIKFEVAGEGDILDVTAKVTLKHSEKTEIEEMKEPAKLWIRGKDEDNKDVKLTLIADEESQGKIAEWLKAAAGEEVEVVFKAQLPKADMDKLNAKECTNTLVF